MSQNIPEIRQNSIGIGDLNITEIRIPAVLTWDTDTSVSVPFAPPVTVQIGVPIVDMPGCVEAHEANEKDNFKINEDDPKGVKTFCDAGVPSFNPIDYNKSKLKYEYKTPVPAFEEQILVLHHQRQQHQKQELQIQKILYQKLNVLPRNNCQRNLLVSSLTVVGKKLLDIN